MTTKNAILMTMNHLLDCIDQMSNDLKVVTDPTIKELLVHKKTAYQIVFQILADEYKEVKSGKEDLLQHFEPVED